VEPQKPRLFVALRQHRQFSKIRLERLARGSMLRARVGFMSKQDEYRQFAADALDMAGKAAAIDSKTRLLNMADAWLNLADRADREPKRPRHPSREHPLVTKVLGPESE
jgi:hypothetical protein